MYLDRVPRLISYHDTWMSIDPIHGCPFQCAYCVLRYGGHTGVRPRTIASPQETLQQIVAHPFFRLGITPLAIGNETDMLHPLNRGFLLQLLSVLRAGGISNPIGLITKAALDEEVIEKIRRLDGLRILFYLSYSGLGNEFEPGIQEESIRENFHLVRRWGFPIIHYWRPLLPENTKQPCVEHMLDFVSGVAEASIVIGLKLHPELSKIIGAQGPIRIPAQYVNEYGEWLEACALERIYSTASRICPDYPIYRHGSCALARVLLQPNHTATIYQQDVCLPSRCPANQRQLCGNHKAVPDSQRIRSLLLSMGRDSGFRCLDDGIFFEGSFNQEQYIYLLHVLNYPVRVRKLEYQNVYRGSIFSNQLRMSSSPPETLEENA